MKVTENLYRSRAHAKFLLCYHVVLVTKYRKPLLRHGSEIQKEVIRLFDQIARRHDDFEILAMGFDIDHVHLLVETTSPTVSPFQIVHRLKSQSTYHLWRGACAGRLRTVYHKKRVFWSAGYFVTTAGEADIDTVRNYVYSQGSKRRKRRQNPKR